MEQQALDNRCQEWLGPFRCELRVGHTERCEFDSGDVHEETPPPRTIDEVLDELNRLVYGLNYEKLVQPGLMKSAFEAWIRPKRNGVLSGWLVLDGSYSDTHDQQLWEAFQAGRKR